MVVTNYHEKKMGMLLMILILEGKVDTTNLYSNFIEKENEDQHLG